jgi:SAM-dependent methyltransferase
MDAVALDFPDDTFDAVLCAFGVFLMPDEVGALKEWRRVLVPGGRMALSVFGAEAFQPLSNLFVERIRAFGVNLHDQPHFSTQKITTPGQCRDLLAAAGFTGIETRSEQLGYSLTSPDEWWEIVVGSGFRGTLARLDPARLDEFKAAHLADVESARTADGLWLDVPAIFASGRK